jgi:hypothetical protein
LHSSANGKFYLKCTCKKFETCGRACRHIYCILGRPPCKNDCSIKHLKIFEAFYSGTDLKFTEICDGILRNPPPGPPVDAEEMTLLNTGGTWDEDQSWFLETLGEIVLRPGINVGGRGKLLF